MTKVKLCGISRECDILAVNEIKPEYIGFVFAKKSKRYVTPQKAAELKRLLSGEIKAVGVFVDESADEVVRLLNEEVIDIAQLHGNEDDDYILEIKERTNKPVIKAFQINSNVDSDTIFKAINNSKADFVLLDAGKGDGKTFDWSLTDKVEREFFLAGGLDINNVNEAIIKAHPMAVDLSSGIETDGVKDKDKMAAIVSAVRKGD